MKILLGILIGLSATMIAHPEWDWNETGLVWNCAVNHPPGEICSWGPWGKMISSEPSSSKEKPAVGKITTLKPEQILNFDGSIDLIMSAPILRIEPNGDIVLRGKKIANDPDIYEAVKTLVRYSDGTIGTPCAER